MEFAEGCPLRADETLRPHVIAIGSNDLDVIVVIKVNLEPAHALAQGALAQMDSGAVGFDTELAANDLLSCRRCSDRYFHGATPRCVGTSKSVDRGTVSPGWHPSAMDTPSPSFTIDCDTCVMQHTDACGDCVVTFICSREPGDAVVVDLNEYRALEMLAESGLVPELRHKGRPGGSRPHQHRTG